MLLAGDEIGRTQSGNNNAYCQDNPTTWLDWSHADSDLLAFSTGLIALRQRFPQLRARAWLSGQAREDGQRDIVWWHPDAREMHDGDWHSPHAAFGCRLAASDARAPELIVLFNPGSERTAIFTPKLSPGIWERRVGDGKVFREHAPFMRELVITKTEEGGTPIEIPPMSVEVWIPR